MPKEILKRMNHFKNKINMRLLLSCCLLLSVFNVFSQENKVSGVDQKVKIDSLYREDQFYFGVTYNALRQQPEGLSQQKFSIGLSTGFLRDMPINKERTIAVASGLGFTYNNYNQNLGITEGNGVPSYAVLSTSAFNNNKFTQLLVDVPIEFRWRASTYESYKFWRIYGGVKFSYLVYDKSVFKDSQGKIVITNNADFNKFLYGVYLSTGFNTINVYAYYGLNSIFKTAKIADEKIDMKSLNIGVIFYIL